MIKQWMSLLKEIEIKPNQFGSEFKTLNELNKLENEIGFIFPVGYKEFCQVFGTGCFGDFITIFYPNIRFSNDCLDAIKNEIIEFPDLPHEKMMSKQSLICLLNSGFVFGREASGISIFWNMNSSDISDKSCDIYWANSDCFSGDIYRIGRNFYEFITEFFLGTKSYKILSKKEWKPKDYLQKTFTCGQLIW